MALSVKEKQQYYSTNLDFQDIFLESRLGKPTTDKKILQDLLEIDTDWKNQIATFETRHRLEKSTGLSNVSSKKALIRFRIRRLGGPEKEQQEKILLEEKNCDLDQAKLEIKFRLERHIFLSDLALETTLRKLKVKDLDDSEKKYLQEIAEGEARFSVNKEKIDTESYLNHRKLVIEKKWTEEKLKLAEKIKYFNSTNI